MRVVWKNVKLKESRDINNVIYASEESKTSNSKNSFEMKKLK